MNYSADFDINTRCPYTAIEPRLDKITGDTVYWLVECRWPKGHEQYQWIAAHKHKWPCDIPDDQLRWEIVDDTH